MAVKTGKGARLFIGPASPTADTITEYEALTWTEVGSIETLAEFGDKASSVTVNVLSEGRTRKGKGAFDAGSMNVGLILAPGDTGQTALKTALASQNAYAFKVDLDDQITPSTGNRTTWYFNGLVMSATVTIGGTNDATKGTVMIDIDSAVLEGPAT